MALKNAWKRFIRLPLTRIVLELLAVIVPVLAAQWAVSRLPLVKTAAVVVSSLISILIGYGAVHAYVRVVEKRSVTEFALKRALEELAGGLVIGALLFASTIGVLAALGVYRVTGIGSGSSVIIPLAGPQWLSGAEFGAEASVVAIVLCTITGLIFVVQAKRKGQFVQPFWRARTFVDVETRL
jgi:hypothetical protein